MNTPARPKSLAANRRPAPAASAYPLRRTRFVPRFLFAAATFALAIFFSTAVTARADEPVTAAPQPLVLREGDELRITFPGAPSLDTTQRIRSDGRITMTLVGEIVATGLTPLQLQAQLGELYAPQLVSREVTVALLSRSFYVYVNGSVLKRGRLDFDRPVTALEAVMAAGFDDGTVNLKAVNITRIEDGTVRTFTLNLDQWIRGKPGDIFYLKQGDMLVVPSKLF